MDNDKIKISLKEDLSLNEKIKSLPDKPGVYQFMSRDGKIIYVGKAQNLRNRVMQYFHKSRYDDPRIGIMISKISDVELIITDNEVEALILEANLIKKYKPKYNVLLKDDKSYPYIAITNEQFPRVIVTRKKNLNARYFGPYVDVKSIRLALKTIRNIFFIRSCSYDMTEEKISQGKYKVCLDYHIKKCEGPCEALVDRKHYNEKIDQAVQVLKGKINSIINLLTMEMNKLSESMRFEEAAVLREKINALKVYSEKQKVVDAENVDKDVLSVVSKDDEACAVIFQIREGKVVGSQHKYISNIANIPNDIILENFIERYYLEQEDIPSQILVSELPNNVEIIKDWLKRELGSSVQINVAKTTEDKKLINLVESNAKYWLDELEINKLKRGDAIPHVLTSLQKDLHLSNVPHRIECFDVSNIQGADSVASLVVFIDGIPRKSEYRKFKIRNVNQIDDFASIAEVIERRYSKIKDSDIDIPDLIIVDGGKGQLSSAMKVMENLKLKSIPVIGLAKRLEEIFLPNQKEPLMLPRTSASLRLLQQIRDEAHRFAITYHKNIRSKRIINTELINIKGVGRKRAIKLLTAFGSIDAIRNATEKQLTDIVGKSTAKSIIDYFIRNKNRL